MNPEVLGALTGTVISFALMILIMWGAEKAGFEIDRE